MRQTAHSHGLQFYIDDKYLASTVASSLLRDGLGDDRLLIVATPAHREAVASELRAAGLDLEALQAADRLVFADARSSLDQMMVNGRPDRVRFAELVGQTVRRLSGPDGATVRIYGEMVDLLWREGNPDAAHELEDLANELCATLPVTILCGYSLDTVDRDETGAHFLRICHSHDHIAPAESYTLDVDLRDAVESAVDYERPAIDAAGQKLTMSVAGEPVVVEGDLGWLTQVVSRLVDNASRYTGRGGHIAVEVESDVETAETWVAVSDTGVGMPPELLSRVFEHDGRGVGLALARQLIELHGGKIEATSGGSGRGSRVIFRLPLKAHTP
jgi:signal transduction histidine kinase